MTTIDIEAELRERLAPAMRKYAADNKVQWIEKQGIQFKWHDGSSAPARSGTGLRLEVVRATFDIPPDFITDPKYFKPVLQWAIANGSSTDQIDRWVDEKTVTETATLTVKGSISYSYKLNFEVGSWFGAAKSEHTFTVNVGVEHSKTETVQSKFAVALDVRTPPHKEVLCLHGAPHLVEPFNIHLTVRPGFDPERFIWTQAIADFKHPHSVETVVRPIQDWLAGESDEFVIDGTVRPNSFGRMRTVYLERDFTRGGNERPVELDENQRLADFLAVGWRIRE